MRNQYMAKVLVHNKVVTQDQIDAHWAEANDQVDIGQVLVKAGLLQQAMYEKVLAFVKNLEAKNAAAAPAKPAAPAEAPAAPAATAAPAPAAPAMKPAPAVASAESAPEEPALQIEGNNIYGESSSSNVVVEKVSGLESTSISNIGISTETEAAAALTTMSLKKVMAYARKFGATAIFLYAGRQVMMRQSGTLFPVTEQTLDKTRVTEYLTEASSGFADGYQVVAGKNFSKTFGLPGVGRGRISVTWDDVNPSVSIRVIQSETVSFDNLFLPQFCQSFVDLPSGLVLVAGPSTSGRSTTVATFAEMIAERRPCYIHTIERPIERLLKNPNGALAQKEVGLHVKTGVAGIELALRDGADVICFDHLESMEELDLLLQAANAGVLVFAVTGGNNIHALLSKLLVSVPESRRASFACTLADQLKGVIVQHLVPVVQNQGLVLACEAMRVTSTVANMIRKGDLSQLVAAISSQKDQGVTLDDSLQMCVESGYIDGAEAWKRAFDSRRFAAYRPA